MLARYVYGFSTGVVEASDHYTLDPTPICRTRTRRFFHTPENGPL